MSALAVLPSQMALKTSLQYPFGATGGTSPYTFKVLSGGAGGTINSSSGLYTSPVSPGIDTILVTDSLGAMTTAQVKVGSPIELVCDILQTSLGLADGRVFLWDQKIMTPNDQGLFIVVGILNLKPFGNTRAFNSDGTTTQSVNMKATLSLDIISRGTDALYRKEEVLMALASTYSEVQQELNSFRIYPITSNFINLSNEDGAAIPYRFNLSLGLQYFSTKQVSDPYFDTFQTVAVTPEP